MPNPSLIICTRDRGDRLPTFLERLPTDAMLNAGVQLVLVDNASRDATGQILTDFARTSDLDVVVASEPEPGLSRARNRGMSEATGDPLVFTDDDCYIDAGYFAALAQHVNDGITWGGGRILPYDPQAPRVAVNMDPRRRDWAAGKRVWPGAIQGANMFVRRELAARLGGFDVRLGAGTRFRCEDIDYIARAAALARGAHLPDLVVHHDDQRDEGQAKAVRRANAVAAGAFYAKQSSRNALGYLRDEIQRVVLGGHPRQALHEVRGFLAFLRGFGWRDD